MKKLVFSFLIIILMLPFIYSCGRPPRKKMPDLSILTEPFNEQSAFSTKEPFIASDTTLNGEHFFSISVPAVSSDSLGWAILQSNQPFAGILYDAMIRLGEKGVLINLCNSQVQQHRTDLTLARKDEFSLPVVLLWDNSSELRMAEFMDAVNQLKNFKCTIIGGGAPGRIEKCLTQHCFEFPASISTHLRTFKPH
jgi:hypothetical protein